MQTEQYTTGEYLRKNPRWHDDEAAWKAAHVLRLIARHGLVCERVYDVGCGSGGVLAELRRALDARTRFEGFDVSPQAIALARGHEAERLSFHLGAFAPDDRPAADLLLALDVAEHVEDYLGFLRGLNRSATWFVFHVPLDVNVQAVLTHSAWMLTMRGRYGHLHYFTRETALATLADCGYRVVDWFYTDDKDPAGAPAPAGCRQHTLFWTRRAFSA